MGRIIIRTTAQATIQETWTINTPDGFNVDDVEDPSDILDHPEKYGCEIYNVADETLGDEHDRDVKEVEVLNDGDYDEDDEEEGW